MSILVELVFSSVTAMVQLKEAHYQTTKLYQSLSWQRDIRLERLLDNNGDRLTKEIATISSVLFCRCLLSFISYDAVKELVWIPLFF